MDKPIPIFVLGCARSGTTSLANLVGLHDDVAGVQHPLHHGNIECPVCYHQRYWGDIGRSDRFIRFLYSIACDDFYQVAGGSLEAFVAQRPHDFFEFFLELMDRHAQSNHSQYWTAKFDMLFFSYPREQREFLQCLQRRYGRQPLMIGIKRPWREQLSSYLNMEGPHNNVRTSFLGAIAATILGLARYHHYNRNIRQIISETDGLLFQFEELRDQPERVAQDIADYLDLPVDGFSQNTAYEPNTSFVKNGAKPATSRSRVSIVAEILEPLLRIPFVSRLVVKGFEATRRLPSPVSTRLLESQYFPADLVQRMNQEGAHGLVRQMNSDE